MTYLRELGEQAMAEVHTFPTGELPPAPPAQPSRREPKRSDRRARLDLAYVASVEIEALSRRLMHEIDTEQSEFERDMIERTLVHRVSELSSVVMSVLGGNDGRPTSDLRQIVHRVDL
jgi:hypothetical protein